MYAPIELAHLVFVDRGGRYKKGCPEPEPGHSRRRHDGSPDPACCRSGMHRVAASASAEP